MTALQQPADAVDWFGQPRGLTILFLTEMWEKFSYYGMRALLVYYMTKELLFGPERASYIYGLYTAIAYLTPIAGGYVSDRWLGKQRAVILGGSIMALGHFLMAFPSLLFPALAVIALGNGLFLPSLPSQIERLYGQSDPRRAGAYNVYYVGVNLGAFLAPLVCGTLGELYGWHYGFGAAGIGMCLGLAVFILGRRYLPGDPMGERTEQEDQVASQANSDPWPHYLPLLGGVLLSVVIFRGAYEQMGNAVALWADASVDRVLLGFEVPASWFQSVNPLLVFVLTPVLVGRWAAAARLGCEPSSLAKMVKGALGVALAYAMLAAVNLYAAAAGIQPSMFYLLAFIGLYTLAELHILPVGLGLFGRLASDQRRGTMIACWFGAAFFGNLLAGYLGGFFQALGNSSFFMLMAIVSLAAAALLFATGRSALGRRLTAAH